jgi:hypothetical protein
MFEVQDLRYATLATVSRCGMVWFSEDVLSIDMICENFMLRLRNVPVEEGEDDVSARKRVPDHRPRVLRRTYQHHYMYASHRFLCLSNLFPCITA